MGPQLADNRRRSKSKRALWSKPAAEAQPEHNFDPNASVASSFWLPSEGGMLSSRGEISPPGGEIHSNSYKNND